jgi:hypothetical protein
MVTFMERPRSSRLPELTEDDFLGLIDYLLDGDESAIFAARDINALYRERMVREKRLFVGRKTMGRRLKEAGFEAMHRNLGRGSMRCWRIHRLSPVGQIDQGIHGQVPKGSDEPGETVEERQARMRPRYLRG